MDIDLTPTDALTAEESAEIHALEERVYGPAEQRRDPAARLTWAPMADTRCAVRVRVGGRLVSVLFVTQRRILVDGQPLLAGGILAVQTDPAYRRQGLARAALIQGTAYLWSELHPDLALLFASEEAVPLYRGLGWQPVEGTVLCDQPDGRIDFAAVMPESTAMLCWPPGAEPRSTTQIDLRGLPW